VPRFLLLACALLVAGCIHANRPTPEQMSRDVIALEGVIGELVALEVTQFADRDWCRGIDYAAGSHSTVTDDSGCLFGATPATFDDASLAAFKDVRDTLDATGVAVSDVTVWRDASGIVTKVEFTLRAGMFDRFSYVFEPGAPLPEEMPHEEEYTRIDPDWYFWWEDWN